LTSKHYIISGLAKMGVGNKNSDRFGGSAHIVLPNLTGVHLTSLQTQLGHSIWILSQSQLQREKIMQIQIHTGHNIEGHEALATQVSDVVAESLSRFSDRITNIDVHLSDENSDKKGGDDDMRCMIEARLTGHHPLAVTHQAATLDQAVDGAAEKVTNLIEHSLGRRSHQASHRTDPPLASSINTIDFPSSQR
jgi:ribosome-associated translation inhibitor RaiA